MAAAHAVTSEGIKEPQSGPRTSRWDAILREDDTRHSMAAAATSTRQTNRGRCHANHHRAVRERGGLRTENPVGSNSNNFNWRRRAANDRTNTGRSTEDDAVIEAIKHVRDSINSYLHDRRGSSDCEEMRPSIELLESSIFQVTDTTNFIDRTHYLNVFYPDKKSLPNNVSETVKWEAGYSILQQVQLLSESSPSCCQFIHSLSFIALRCLRSLTNRRPDVISTVDACECLSILVGILRRDIFDHKMGNMDEVLKYKSTLFACLAIVLSIATRNTGAPQNKRDTRPSLLPWGAEKTVNMVLKETALPYLDLLLKGKDASSCSSENVIYCHGAMECIYILLRDPKWETTFDTIVPDSTAQLSKYASAILAPLIVDILPDGKEKQHINPLRSKTLIAICTFWNWSFEYVIERTRVTDDTAHRSMILLMSCQCMAAALNALSALRKSKSQNIQDVPHEIDVVTVARQLQCLIQNNEFLSYRPKFMSLVALLYLVYPSSSTSQWHLFLEQSPTSKELTMLSIMDKGTAALNSGNLEDACWIALPNALHATSLLLTAMPFSLWISGETRSLARMSGGHFASRIRTSLLQVMNCICNMMVVIRERVSDASVSIPSMEIVMKLVSEVAGKLCTILPTNGENKVLLRSSVRIIQCAGDIYVHSVSATKLEPAEDTLLTKAMSIFGSVIIESLGASSIAPETVSISTISAPASAWLTDASSYDFIGMLLTDSRWLCPSSRERMEMLSAIAKGSPSTLVREPYNLASFCEVCTSQSAKETALTSRNQGLKLIESFIYGRKTSSIDNVVSSAVDSVIRQTFIPLLLIALDDFSAATRTSAASSFGSLLRSDWLDSSTINSTPLESILRLCSTKHENVASVRAASCKAVGDIVLSFVESTLHRGENGNDNTVSGVDNFVLSFAGMVCEAMQDALVDNAAPVRSMALYAIGNTSFALKEHFEQDAVSIVPSMKDIFLPVCMCLDDRDDKVVANAVRTISHASYFVYSQESLIDSAAMATCKDLLAKLSSKVNFSLDDAVGGAPKGLTWKRRHGAKKQTRGSCTTLGVLLNYSILIQNVDVEILKVSLSCLFRCILLSCHVNEKIVGAAVTSLLGLPNSLWQRISCNCDSVGRGLATIFGYLERENSRTTRYIEIESLAISLLEGAKESDFCHLFLIREDSIPFSVEYFYQWLVEHDVKLSIYEEIAAAVSSDIISRMLDVSAVQMFLSRAIRQQYQAGESPRKFMDITDKSLDDDGDEL